MRLAVQTGSLSLTVEFSAFQGHRGMSYVCGLSQHLHLCFWLANQLLRTTVVALGLGLEELVGFLNLSEKL